MTSEPIQLSIIIPIHNEETIIPLLWDRLQAVLPRSFRSYEIIAVDDGSQDQSLTVLQNFLCSTSHLKIVELDKNYGQHPALCAGFSVARGQYLVTMDADLQVDPEEIPRIVEPLRQGADFVSGIRQGIGDSVFKRRLPSKIVSRALQYITGKRLMDFGCPFNAFHKRVVDRFPEYGSMQRFLKPLAVRVAQHIAEVRVGFQPRVCGHSKYSLLSLVDLFFDFVTNFSKHLFQRLIIIGFVFFLSSMAITCAYLLCRFALCIIDPMPRLLAFCIILMIFSTQLSVLGILGEFVIRIYRNMQSRPLFTIRKIWTADHR